MAAVRIDDKAFADARFAMLAKLMKLSEADHAIIKVARIWQMQTEMYTPQRPTYIVNPDIVAAVLGPKGADYLRMVGLAEDADGGLYMKGSQGRIEWLWNKKQSASAAGKASASARAKARLLLNGGSTDVERAPNDCQTDEQPPLSENATDANVLTLSPSQGSYEPSERYAASPPKAPASPRKKPARQLPADWAPSEAHADIARERGVDMASEAVKFRDWAASKAEAKADWDAAFRNWLRNAKKPYGAAQVFAAPRAIPNMTPKLNTAPESNEVPF